MHIRPVSLRTALSKLYWGVAILLAVAGTPSHAAAQQVAVKAGVSSSNLSLSADRQLYIADWQTGFIAGVSFTQPLHRETALQIESLVNLRDGIHGDALKLTYLEVPVMVRLRIWRSSTRGIFICGGPQFAFNLYGNYEAAAQSESAGRKIDHVEAGLTFGGGVELNRVAIDIRYAWALTSAFVEDDPGADFKSRTFVAMVGFRIGK